MSSARGIRSRLATVRARLTLLATALVASVLVAAAVGLVGVQRHALTAAVDDTLRQRVENLGSSALQPNALRNEGD